jgi:hypothetical protein
MPVEIVKATYLGSHWDFVVAAPVGELFVTQQGGSDLQPGSSVHLVLLEDRLALVKGDPNPAA